MLSLHDALPFCLADLDAGGLEGLLLRLCGSRRAGHDRPGVAHRLALGGGEARNVADDRLGDVRLDEVGRALFRVAADLTDHDDRLRLGVRSEEHTSEIQSLMRISYAVFCMKN